MGLVIEERNILKIIINMISYGLRARLKKFVDFDHLRIG